MENRSRVAGAVFVAICLGLLAFLVAATYLLYVRFTSTDLTPQISAEIERTADYSGVDENHDGEMSLLFLFCTSREFLRQPLQFANCCRRV